ncbi:flavin-dependent oxidoreductase [Roseomonas sp. SSH11]|uniref:Flavin-dependent oxidoreductase n=1 Tax=Pararoseomonas baculiformis TaxID=2820812 RepID=A0ABS4A8H5_9PROT|nr:flavin-dependent oxidoreductase [Pararoseomonas baculiformis]MBP0443301.1 flavin-dependent oxidoreductase [Pararoseomonas baculiformis]
MHIVISGGGISGLTLAMALHQAGIGVEVHEAVSMPKPLGVGINLLPHSVRELTELGLGERVLAAGVPTRDLLYATRRGEEVWREDRGLAAGYRWPQVSIHRGTLFMLLLEAARERLGDAIHLGSRGIAAESDAEGATLHLEGGGRARGDAVVAADGIHSAIRATWHPHEGAPRWNGSLMWRAVSEHPGYLTGRTMVQAGSSELKFVCYPIREATAERPALINWIAERRMDPSTHWAREDWNRPGRIEDFLPDFAGWEWPWLSVPSLIRAAPAVWEFPMVDRDPLPEWTRGRVTLLGDAAHPMYPIGSNGASQGILDARTLAFHLATEGEVTAGLRAYEATRRPATSALVQAARGQGPDLVLDLAEQRAPQGFAAAGGRESVLPMAELEGIARDYKRKAGFDPVLLNARPSLSARLGSPSLARH